MDILENAHNLACGHTFCKTCIENLSDNTRQCPLCKKRFRTGDIAPNYMVNSQVESLGIQCPLGCAYVGGSRARIRSHRPECVKRVVICNNCGNNITFCDMTAHLRDVCDQMRCGSLECSFKSTWKEVMDHQVGCMLYKNMIFLDSFLKFFCSVSLVGGEEEIDLVTSSSVLNTVKHVLCHGTPCQKNKISNSMALSIVVEAISPQSLAPEEDLLHILNITKMDSIVCFLIPHCKDLFFKNLVNCPVQKLGKIADMMATEQLHADTTDQLNCIIEYVIGGGGDQTNSSGVSEGRQERRHQIANMFKKYLCGCYCSDGENFCGLWENEVFDSMAILATHSTFSRTGVRCVMHFFQQVTKDKPKDFRSIDMIISCLVCMMENKQKTDRLSVLDDFLVFALEATKNICLKSKKELENLKTNFDLVKEKWGETPDPGCPAVWKRIDTWTTHIEEQNASIK
jgi:hypothetical protein